MITKTKSVYYCSFCKKYRLSRRAMEHHERHCTLNPERVCRWDLPDERSPRQIGPNYHTLRKGVPRWIRIFAPLKGDQIDRLREHCGGCPSCMLSAIRLSGVDRFYLTDHTCTWDYDEEVKRYREEEREYWIYQERRDIEASFL